MLDAKAKTKHFWIGESNFILFELKELPILKYPDGWKN